MAEREPSIMRVHTDPVLFREALNYTMAQTGFPARLIEKDYYCTLLLSYFAGEVGELVFKGGTCLAKVHGDFYRLSEDLDFAIPMSITATRSARSSRANPVKDAIAGLSRNVPCFRVTRPLRGANRSTQYLGSVGYRSLITQQEETITIEVSLREPLLQPSAPSPVRTIILDPATGLPAVAPVTVPCMARAEAWAEKFRAALTRRDAAIRDFFDLDYATRILGMRADDAELLKLIGQKLDVAGNDPIDIGMDRLKRLRAQLNSQLKPVLREADFDAFDLDRVYKIVASVAEQLNVS